MRFSVAATAVLAGAANASLEAGGHVSQIPDGQVQAPGPDSPAASLPPVITTSAPAASPETTAEGDSTIYQTVEVTITSCGPSVKSCPATTSPYVTTSVIPVVPSSNPAPVPTTPAEVPSSAPVEVPGSAPAVPISSTLGSSPVDQTSEHAAPPAGTTPAPEVPSSTLGSSPVGASSICDCPAPVTECPAPPAPVTIYSTVTVAPSGVPTGAAPGNPAGSTPGASAPGAPGSPDVSAPGAPGNSPVGSTPGAPGSSPVGSTPGAPGNSPVGSTPGAPGSSPVGSSPVVPGASSPSGSAPIVVPGAPGSSPVGATPAAPFPVGSTGVPGPVGTAPIGTASTGGVTPPSPTGSPISAFTGAASSLSGSFVAVGLAAIVAIFRA